MLWTGLTKKRTRVKLTAKQALEFGPSKERLRKPGFCQWDWTQDWYVFNSRSFAGDWEQRCLWRRLKQLSSGYFIFGLALESFRFASLLFASSFQYVSSPTLHFPVCSLRSITIVVVMTWWYYLSYLLLTWQQVLSFALDCQSSERHWVVFLDDFTGVDWCLLIIVIFHLFFAYFQCFLFWWPVVIHNWFCCSVCLCVCVYIHIATVLSAVWNPLGRESLLP